MIEKPKDIEACIDTGNYLKDEFYSNISCSNIEYEEICKKSY